MKKIFTAVIAVAVAAMSILNMSAFAQGTNYFTGNKSTVDECACKITKTTVDGTVVYDVTNMSSSIGFPNMAIYDASKRAFESQSDKTLTLIAAFDARMDFAPGVDVITANITLRNWDFNKANMSEYEAINAKSDNQLLFYPPVNDGRNLVIKLQNGVQFTNEWQTYAVSFEVTKDDFQNGAGTSWGLSLDHFDLYASVRRAQIKNVGVYLESEYEYTEPEEVVTPTPEETAKPTATPTATAGATAAPTPKSDESGYYTIDSDGNYVAVSNADLKTMEQGTAIYQKNGDKYVKGQIVDVNGSKGFKADSTFNPLFVIIPVAAVVVIGAVIAVIVIKKKKK